MIQRLKINISAANNVNILMWLNQVPTSIDSVMNLDLDIDNVIEIRQATSKNNMFFYIDSVCLGGLDITQLLHHQGICRVLDPGGNKIADFIPDIGPTDQVVIRLNRDFYYTVEQFINIVYLL
jgi:hypothetical protein